MMQLTLNKEGVQNLKIIINQFHRNMKNILFYSLTNYCVSIRFHKSLIFVIPELFLKSGLIRHIYQGC